jgi:hypothetical protein
MAEQESKTGSSETLPAQQAVSRRRMLKTLGGAATVGAGAMLVGPAATAGATGTPDKTTMFLGHTKTAVLAENDSRGDAALFAVNDASAGTGGGCRLPPGWGHPVANSMGPPWGLSGRPLMMLAGDVRGVKPWRPWLASGRRLEAGWASRAGGRTRPR